MKKSSIIIAGALLSCSLFFGQTEKEKVLETIDKNTIEGHIYFLTDDLLRGRETGTVENKIAASYLANTLRSYGAKPNPETGTYYQDVILKKIEAPKNVKVSLKGIEINNAITLKADAINYTADAIYANFGLENDYKKLNVKGKLVVVRSGNSESNELRPAFGLMSEKAKLARNAGAVGLIEIVSNADQDWEAIAHHFDEDKLENIKNEDSIEKSAFMPYVWIKELEEMNLNLKLGATLPVTLKMDAPKESEVHSQNVIGIIEGTDPKLKNEYIIYSAHYDHVGIGAPDATGDTIYNGARDNAVGTTTVLSVAQNLSKYPTKRSALFILFTGEEKGLLGSSYYTEHPVLPLKQMVYCFNSDNGGYNDTSVATIVGLERTTASHNIKEAAKEFGLTAIDDPAPEQNLFDRSDNVYFAAKGIPAPTYSLGFRSFDGEVTKYYHQAGDEAESLDYDYLLKFFQSYVLSSRLIANDPQTPFWVKGDKYESAGNTLYNK